YRTQLINTIRGHAAEFGLTAAKGPAHVEPLLLRVAEDARVPELARELFTMHGRELSRLKSELREIEAKLKVWHRQNEISRRLRSRCHRPDRRLSAGDQGSRSAGLPLRPRLRGLDGSDPERSFHRRQGSARGDYPRRRRGLAPHLGAGRHLGDQAGEQGPGQSLALAAGSGGAKTAEARRRGARQQARAHHLETDGQRPTL